MSTDNIKAIRNVLLDTYKKLVPLLQNQRSFFKSINNEERFKRTALHLELKRYEDIQDAIWKNLSLTPEEYLHLVTSDILHTSTEIIEFQDIDSNNSVKHDLLDMITKANSAISYGYPEKAASYIYFVIYILKSGMYVLPLEDKFDIIDKLNIVISMRNKTIPDNDMSHGRIRHIAMYNAFQTDFLKKVHYYCMQCRRSWCKSYGENMDVIMPSCKYCKTHDHVVEVPYKKVNTKGRENMYIVIIQKIKRLRDCFFGHETYREL